MILCYGCPGDGTITPFDHAAQALIDKDSLSEFLKSHYYDDALDSIKPLKSGKTALINDSNLKSKMVTYN